MELNDNNRAVADPQEQPQPMQPPESFEEIDKTVFQDSFQALGHFDIEQNNTDASDMTRQGTISSARFNILSAMVGGGSLSLPLAFAKMGNALVGPLILIVTAVIAEFSFRVLLDAARTLSPVHSNRPGKDSLERICAAAFGGPAYCLSTVLVTFMCFFGIVGYCVLLRDMLEPVTDFITPFTISHRTGASPAVADNLTMMLTVFAVTPLCTLQMLTALQKFGAASMCSVFILGVCILYRSLQCTTGYTEHYHTADSSNSSSWTDGFRLWPAAWKDALDVMPLFIYSYVCHYFVPVVHNELQDPTPARLQWWLRSTVWGSTLFYMTVGIAGSAYATACSDGIHGNILLDFPDDDPLLLTGRLCLAVTITLAFPMLTLPPRDILIRTVAGWATKSSRTTENIERNDGVLLTFKEPLLKTDASVEQVPTATTPNAVEEASNPVVELSTAPPSLGVRLLASVAILWTGAAVASGVSSIDVVLNLLGSSLSILVSYLIPSGCYLVISKQKPQAASRKEKRRDNLTAAVCWLLILVFTPLMFVSTANAVYNTFFLK